MKDFSKVRCQICNEVGKWENVDNYRYKKRDMNICTHCGFVTYPDVYLKLNDLKDHYKTDYRLPPTVDNVFSSERKLHYHINFLEDLFKEWKEKKLDNFSFVEVGAALGMFMNWIKHKYPRADIEGTELTTSFIRAAYWVYNLKLKSDIDVNKKYDMIMSYKVAEHQPNFDLELRKYRECLKDDGYLYISVPTWFNILNSFGMNGFSLEYYYDKNHVNVWSKEQFEYLLDREGFKIVKYNGCYYDDTYLCKKTDVKTKELPKIYTKTKEHLRNIFEAAQAFDETAYDKAVQHWPNFPEAWHGFYESNRAKFDKQGLDAIVENVFKPALASCPDSSFIEVFVADVFLRYNRPDDAINHFNRALDKKPMDIMALNGIAQALRFKAMHALNEQDRFRLYQEAMGIMGIVEKNSLQGRYQAITWILQDAAHLPVPQ